MCNYISSIFLEYFQQKKYLKNRMRTGESLKLGDLSGNRFKIAIRKVKENNLDLIKEGIVHLKNHGFINYFGLQRFGTCTQVPTHSIGIQLILNNVKEAIDLILKPRQNGKL